MRIALFFAIWLVANLATAGDLSPVWEVGNFKMPESVVYDEKRDRFYVSNVNAGVMEQDGNGSVGLINSDGKSSNVDWVTGLSSPKGMDLYGKHLYVADVKELVVIDVEKAAIIARYLAPETGVLNGLAVSPKGEVYVSDWMANKIYKLEQNGLELWADSVDLESPNGLFVDNKHIYICAWGNGTREDFSTESSGALKRISLRDKKIENVSDGSRWMNLDGLHKKGKNSWLATDFMKGELLEFDKAGEISDTYKLAPSAADFFYVAEKNLLVVPYLMGNKVVAYRVEG